MTDDSTD